MNRSTESRLAAALVEALDDQALELLAERLGTRLGEGNAAGAAPVVYTTATLARELELTERQIRAAIHRGELDATKRGRTYLLTREAVEAWAAPDVGRPRGGAGLSSGRPRRRVMTAALARLDEER